MNKIFGVWILWPPATRAFANQHLCTSISSMVRPSKYAVCSILLGFHLAAVAEFAPRITGGNVWGNQIVPEGCSASFHVEVWGTQPFYYQWFRDGVPLPGETSDWFVIWETSLADFGTTYYVVVSNAYGSVQSDVAGLQVWNDFAPPNLVSAQAGTKLDQIKLSFYGGSCGSRPLEPFSASDISNYAISDGLQVLAAELDSSGTNVFLTTSRQRPHTTYLVVVTNVTDVFGNAITSQNKAVFEAPPRGTYRRPQARSGPHLNIHN